MAFSASLARLFALLIELGGEALRFLHVAERRGQRLGRVTSCRRSAARSRARVERGLRIFELALGVAEVHVVDD